MARSFPPGLFLITNHLPLITIRGSFRVCQALLALALLVLCVFADHPDHSLAGDDLALDANLLYRCTDLHLFAALP